MATMQKNLYVLSIMIPYWFTFNACKNYNKCRRFNERAMAFIEEHPGLYRSIDKYFINQQ
jgi:hypothetical protein